MGDTEGFVNPALVMTPEALHNRLGDPDLCVVDTRPTHAYAAGHIPGAVHLDFFGLSLVNTGPETFDGFMLMMGYLMSQRGIGSNQTVVFYEDIASMRAARGFWFCEYLGHPDVHLLDGGLRAWTAAGYPVTTACMAPPRALFEARPVPERHINADALRDRLGSDDLVVLDVRSSDEYFGRLVRAARGGAIPGAVHLEYVHNLDEAGRFKPASDLREVYERLGVTPEQTVACY